MEISLIRSGNILAGILRATTPSMLQPISCYYYTANADTPTTPVTSIFRLRLLLFIFKVNDLKVFYNLFLCVFA